VRLSRANEFIEAPIHWLWAGRIPIGQTTIIEGDPGTAKSQLTIALAAHISTGLSWPDGAICEQAHVLMANAEDPEEEVIIPRLKAAGANLDNVFILSSSDKGSFTIPDNVETIHQRLKAEGVKLFVIDPFEAFLSNAVDSYRNHHIRRALRTLEGMAKDLNLAVVIVRHLTKDSQRSAIYRGTGSIGIIGAARAGYNVSKDPANPSRSILTAVKLNWAKPKAALAYKIVDLSWSTKDGEAIETSRIEWDGEVEVKADDLSYADPTISPGEVSDAITFIRSELEGGALSVRELFATASRLGIAKKSLYRAARVMGIIKRREGGLGSDGHWVWEMPAEVSYGQFAGNNWQNDLSQDNGTVDDE
jgi:hypothetical protein